MEATHDTDKRLINLEIKASFAEDLLEQLNRTVFLQQQQIEQLARELAALRQQIPQDSESRRSLRDDLPPHY